MIFSRILNGSLERGGEGAIQPKEEDFVYIIIEKESAVEHVGGWAGMLK